LIAGGVTDLNRYLAENPEALSRCAAMVRIVDANRAALSLYGADTAATLGHLAAVLPDDQSILFRKELLGLLKEGGSEIIIANRTLAGAPLTVERRAVVAAGFEQSWRKVFVTVLDLTEQIRLRQQNKSFEKQLQQTQKLEAIGSLAGGIAHDFNNILPPILGRAELMLLELGGNEPLRGHCRGIVDAAKRARSLVKLTRGKRLLKCTGLSHNGGADRSASEAMLHERRQEAEVRSKCLDLSRSTLIGLQGISHKIISKQNAETGKARGSHIGRVSLQHSQYILSQVVALEKCTFGTRRSLPARVYARDALWRHVLQLAGALRFHPNLTVGPICF
jgi:signal transduction histidine kinase